VREAGEHGVFQRIQLVFQRRVDARVGMAEQVHPPRADGVEVAAAFMVVQPCALAPADGDQRDGFVVLHLGARMPYAAQAARDPVALFIQFQNCSYHVITG
jgi:hypothetical protein